MGQADVDYASQAYLSWGKIALGPNWGSLGYSDAQIIAIGRTYYNSLPPGPSPIQNTRLPVFNAPVLSASDVSVGGTAIPGTSGLTFKSPA